MEKQAEFIYQPYCKECEGAFIKLFRQLSYEEKEMFYNHARFIIHERQKEYDSGFKLHKGVAE